tara:strand:+ start:59 stop:217 length:159 start_codon:yes stop_codon:yes gene_type:complete
MLDKLMKELKEFNRMAQVYYKEEQWALLDMTLEKISTWSTMISKQLEKKEIA